MNLENFFPDMYTTIIYLLLGTSAFENQRWVRARVAGKCGNTDKLTEIFLIDYPGFFIGTCFNFLFLGALWYDTNWIKPLMLLVLDQIVGIIFVILQRIVLKKSDSFVVWILGTVGLFIFCPLLFRKVSWFGLFP